MGESAKGEVEELLGGQMARGAAIEHSEPAQVVVLVGGGYAAEASQPALEARVV